MLASLIWRGLIFCSANSTRRRSRTRRESIARKLDLVGCHGQTLYHQGEPAPYLGRKLAVTWQTGEGAVIAARLSVPVISDFRPADMAAGGKGAPLVPFLDYFLYRDERVGRIAQNIGGIANLTAIPAKATSAQVTAFDTGPGNMIIDAVMQKLFGRSYDRDGKIAASGEVKQKIVDRLMRAKFFRQTPSSDRGPRRVWQRICKRIFETLSGDGQG